MVEVKVCNTMPNKACAQRKGSVMKKVKEGYREGKKRKIGKAQKLIQIDFGGIVSKDGSGFLGVEGETNQMKVKDK